MTAKELPVFGREHADAWMAALEQQAETLEGRFGAREERRERWFRRRPQTFEVRMFRLVG